MSTVYGSDTTCVSDLPLIDLQVTDAPLLIGQRIARRLTTPHGALANISDDPNFGYDVRQFINAKVSATQIASLKSDIEAQCYQDEQIETAQADVTFSNGALAITLSLVSSAGPFVLTLNVSALTTDLVFSFT